MSSEPEARRVIRLRCSTCGAEDIPLGNWPQHVCPGPKHEAPANEQQPMTESNLHTGTRGEYSQWVIETRLDPCRLGIAVTRNPYRELARRDLEELRAAHPGLTFRAVRETITRTEEDW